MSERKVISKYFPPDFDYREIPRRHGPNNAGPKVQPVRLMAPFSMRCTMCGEYINRGRTFNARKETPDEKYLGVQMFRFYIRCTRCPAAFVFRTDPRNDDYACERGAKRNHEPWYASKEETIEERLDRLAKEDSEDDDYEEDDDEEGRNAMVELEAKTVDAKRELAVADALDEIRMRNARLERVVRSGAEVVLPDDEAAETSMEKEDAEAAKLVFTAAKLEGTKEDPVNTNISPPLFRFVNYRVTKKKVMAKGIKRKEIVLKALVD